MPDVQTDARQELLELLEQQVGLYEQLAELASRQRRLIDDGATEGLLELLAQRQTLVDQLGALTRRLEPFRRDWPAMSRRLSVPQRLRSERLLGRANALLETIMQTDEHDSRTLARHKQQASRALRGARERATAVAAYGETATTPRAPAYVDSLDAS